MSAKPSPGLVAQMACILEVTARKPGNVHRFCDFDDSTYLDFLLSAAAIARPLDLAVKQAVGATILAAVQATRGVVSTNTNLGMILLLTPFAAVPPDEDLRSGVGRVLDNLSVEDARLAYEAIRLANPGGLGSANSQDILGDPTVTLREAMAMAADRDLIARQYANGYAEVFDLAVPSLQSGLADLPLEAAIVRAFLTVLARMPDTLIMRKRGPVLANEASRRAAHALATGEIDPFDRWLRQDGHARNPGATADLIVAALFVALRQGAIAMPRPAGSSGFIVGECPGFDDGDLPAS